MLRSCLAESLGLLLQRETPSNHYIIMETGDVILAGATTTTPESYRIEVDGDKPSVRIVGRDKAGVFYGVQTLISLALDKRGIPTGHISDQPRYPYRGLMLDVARNFRSKEDVLRLIDVMAMYKLNKLHLHLADDEGWRLEIPGLPELTQVGQHSSLSTHAHTPTRTHARTHAHLHTNKCFTNTCEICGKTKQFNV